MLTDQLRKPSDQMWTSLASSQAIRPPAVNWLIEFRQLNN
jgi:hypothetical protein